MSSEFIEKHTEGLNPIEKEKLIVEIINYYIYRDDLSEYTEPPDELTGLTREESITCYILSHQLRTSNRERIEICRNQLGGLRTLIQRIIESSQPKSSAYDDVLGSLFKSYLDVLIEVESEAMQANNQLNKDSVHE